MNFKSKKPREYSKETLYFVEYLRFNAQFQDISVLKIAEIEVANTQFPVCFETFFCVFMYFAYARFLTRCHQY